MLEIKILPLFLLLFRELMGMQLCCVTALKKKTSCGNHFLTCKTIPF